MTCDSAWNLSENIPDPLTPVFGFDSGPADDDFDFHSIAHPGTT
jgi:hypothetical protein